MKLPGESARVFRVADQSRIDSKWRERRAEGVETLAAGILKPSVKGFPPGRENRGETPAEALPEPSHEGERVGEMAGKFGGRLRLSPILAVKVEDDIGSALDPVAGTGDGSGLPCGGRGHRAKGIGWRLVPVLHGAPAIPEAGAGLVNGAGPNKIRRKKESGEESARVVGGIVWPGWGIFPKVGAVPLVVVEEVGAVFAGEGFELSLCLIPLPARVIVALALGTGRRWIVAGDSDKLPDAPTVAGIGNARELPAWEDGEVISGPVVVLLGASGTTGRDLPSGMVANLFEAGEVEGLRLRVHRRDCPRFPFPAIG